MEGKDLRHYECEVELVLPQVPIEINGESIRVIGPGGYGRKYEGGFYDLSPLIDLEKGVAVEGGIWLDRYKISPRLSWFGRKPTGGKEKIKLSDRFDCRGYNNIQILDFSGSSCRKSYIRALQKSAFEWSNVLLSDRVVERILVPCEVELVKWWTEANGIFRQVREQLGLDR